MKKEQMRIQAELKEKERRVEDERLEARKVE